MLSGEFQKGMNKMPYYYYWDWTYLLIIPGLILGLIAQAKVKSAYAQCSRIPAKCGLTASQMVADLAPPQRQHPRARRACVRRTDRPL